MLKNILFAISILCLGCDPVDSCPDQGAVRCNSDEVQILNPYCEWETFEVCEENEKCVIVEDFPTCVEK